jgi:hypothetical protein
MSDGTMYHFQPEPPIRFTAESAKSTEPTLSIPKPLLGLLRDLRVLRG